MLLGAADNLSAEPEDAGPDERKRRIYEAVASVILAKAVDSPLFVIVEDTHWIDPSSQILLENLSARLGNHDAIQRVLVLMTTQQGWRCTGGRLFLPCLHVIIALAVVVESS